MSLAVDPRKIVQAKIVPWEDGLFGIAWETDDNRSGADMIGTKAEAQAVLRSIIKQRTDKFGRQIVTVMRSHG